MLSSKSKVEPGNEAGSTTSSDPSIDEDSMSQEIWFEGDIAQLIPHDPTTQVDFGEQYDWSLREPNLARWIGTRRNTESKAPENDLRQRKVESDSDSESEIESQSIKKPNPLSLRYCWRINFGFDGSMNPNCIIVGTGSERDGSNVDIPLTSNRHAGIRKRHFILRIHLELGLVSITCAGRARVSCSSSEPAIQNTTYFFPTSRAVELLSLGIHVYQLEWMPWAQDVFAKYMRILRGKQGINELPPPHLTGVHSAGHNQVGRYVHQNDLGSGSQGNVVAGFSTDNGRAVAIKTLSNSGYNYADMHQERQLTKMLKHRNVIELVDVVDQRSSNNGGKLYMMLSPLCYASLADIPANMSSADRLKVMSQVSHALNYVHNVVKMMHRDIKPGNVLYRRVGRNDVHALLTDFGHSTLDKTSTNHRRGTVRYLAPEILMLRNEEFLRLPHTNPPYDQKADVFSLGLTFAELAIDGHITSYIGKAGITYPAREDIKNAMVRHWRFGAPWIYTIDRMFNLNPNARQTAKALAQWVEKEGYPDIQSLESSKRHEPPCPEADSRTLKKKLTAEGNVTATRKEEPNRERAEEEHANRAAPGAPESSGGRKHDLQEGEERPTDSPKKDNEKEKSLSGSMTSLSIKSKPTDKEESPPRAANFPGET